eukprot:3433885-Pyramimonas_sp.AAC.1
MQQCPLAGLLLPCGVQAWPNFSTVCCAPTSVSPLDYRPCSQSPGTGGSLLWSSSTWTSRSYDRLMH